MNWRGNSNLNKSFIPFLFLLALAIGEVVPVVVDGVPAGQPGAKESMFSGWSMVIPTIIIYGLLSLFFWFLYRKLHWLIVAILAAVLGVVMEFTLMRPQEAGGPNVVENPLGALLFFIIIWPILLVLPYGLYQFLSKRGWLKYAFTVLGLVVLILSILTVIYKL